MQMLSQVSMQKFFQNAVMAAAFATSFTLLVPRATAQMSPARAHHIYDSHANARADIAAALKRAKLEHKRVILDFGGDWCGDCQVLYIYLHQPQNQQILDKNFVIVSIDIGHEHDGPYRNVDIAKQYGIPLEKGTPALAVLESNGRLLYSQKNKEGEMLVRTDITSVTEFLNKWKKS